MGITEHLQKNKWNYGLPIAGALGGLALSHLTGAEERYHQDAVNDYDESLKQAKLDFISRHLPNKSLDYMQQVIDRDEDLADDRDMSRWNPLNMIPRAINHGQLLMNQYDVTNLKAENNQFAPANENFLNREDVRMHTNAGDNVIRSKIKDENGNYMDFKFNTRSGPKSEDMADPSLQLHNIKADALDRINSNKDLSKHALEDTWKNNPHLLGKKEESLKDMYTAGSRADRDYTLGGAALGGASAFAARKLKDKFKR
jgi:hypothetical protein